MAGKVIGRVEVNVAAKVRNNRPEMQRDLDKDLDAMRRATSRRKPIEIPLDLDQDEFERKLRKMERDIERKGRKFTIAADLDDEKAKADLQRLRDRLESMAKSKLTINLDRREFDKKMKALSDSAAEITAKVSTNKESMEKTKSELKKFREDAEQDINVGVDVHGLAAVGARLSFATRPRRVRIIATVDAKALAVATGLLRSLAGVNTLQTFGRRLENIITNFDEFAGSITKTLTLVGTLTNVMGYLGTSMFSIGGGIAQIGSLAAILPTLAASLASVFGVMRIGFNNFAESFSDIPIIAEQALAKLPPAARKARDALVGVFKDFQDPIQNLFWEVLGEHVSDFANVLVPRVQKGMLKITDETALMVKGVSDSFLELARNGSLDTMFGNLEKGLREANKGVKPFFDAINTLGLRGSDHLERMGRALHNAADTFNEFIQHAEKTGQIEGWINKGTEALKDTWGAAVALVDQFQALTQIIDAAGGQSIDGFRQNMEAWARVMESEPFRSRMLRIFRGARDGAGELNVGLKKLLGTLGEMSTQVEALEVSLGKIGGTALERISDILGRKMLQAGLLNGLQEVQHALTLLAPAARNMGDIFGQMFDIAGNVLIGVAPMMNQVSAILRTIAFELAPSIKETIPTLTEFLRDFIQLFGGGLEVAATVLSGVLDVVNSLPTPLRNLTLAFGTFLALRGRLGGMLTAMGNFWSAQKTSIVNGVSVTETNAQKFSRAYDRMGSSVVNTTKRIGPALKNGGLHFLYGTGDRYQREFNKMSAAAEGGASRIERTVGRVKTAATNFGRALGGIMSWGGGLGGMLVFTAIVAGISAIGDAARQKREDVESFKTTLDEFGNVTDESREAVAKWAQDTKVLGFDNLLKGFESIGVATQDVIDGLSGSEGDFDHFFSMLQAGQQDATKALEDYTAAAVRNGEIAGGVGTEEWNRLNNTQQAYEKIIREVTIYRDKVNLAKTEQKQIADALGVTNEEAKTLQEAIRKLGDEYADADDQASSLSRALDILNGSMDEQDEATMAAADAIRNLKAAIKEATTGDNKIKLSDMIDTKTGEIDFSFKADPTGAFAQIHQGMMETVQTGVREGINAGTSAPPQGKLIALKAAYESAVGEIKTQLRPELGNKTDVSVNAWLKRNGYDWTTIESLVTGKMDEATMSKIPAEARQFIKGLIGADPFVKVPIDGDYLPLKGKMTIVDGMLTKLGATETNPKIGADGKKLDSVTKTALDKLRGISNTDTEAIIDGDIGGLTEKEQVALQKLYGIDNYKAIPEFDANGQPLDAEVRIAMAKLLGIDDKETIAKIEAESSQLQREAREASKKLDMVKQDHPAPIDADGDPARREGETTEQYINRMRQARAIPIDADGRNAKTEANEVEQRIDNIDQNREPRIDANGEPAKRESRWVQQQIDEIEQRREPRIDANGDPAQREVNWVEDRINDIVQWREPRIDANGNPAKNEIGNVLDRLWYLGRQYVSPTADIDVWGMGQLKDARWYLLNMPSTRYSTLYVTTVHQQRGAGPGYNTAMANGGIIHQSFASGGLKSKPLSAHIAPAGSYITYAERETGGEAFIPLAASKRARSTRILDEVAGRFGYDLKSRHMADGGVIGGSSAGASFSIGQLITSNPDDAVRKLRNMQNDALAIGNLEGA